MQIQCTKKGCKKKHDKCSKILPIWDQTSRKSLSKTGPKIDAKKEPDAQIRLAGRRYVAGAPLRLIISAFLVFGAPLRLIISAFLVFRFISSRFSSRRGIFSRLGASCLLSGIQLCSISASSDASWLLLAVLWRLVSSVIIMSMDRQRCPKYRCRKFHYQVLNARSLKRSMLHTCSGVISRCEFKG